MRLTERLIGRLRRTRGAGGIELSRLGPNSIFGVKRGSFVILRRRCSAAAIVSGKFVTRGFIFSRSAQSCGGSGLGGIVRGYVRPIVRSRIKIRGLIRCSGDLLSISGRGRFRPYETGIVPPGFNLIEEFGGLVMGGSLSS